MKTVSRSPALRALHRSLRYLFALGADTDHEGTVRHITEDVDFRGGNLWALVLAILVASIGLNVNSTAVVIGAMLISPLMGPIVGAGLGIGTNDLDLLKLAARNLVVAAVVSVATSALYFALSPLDEAQSELLARTRPSLYDVLIAFFGGSAGIIAASRKTAKGHVVPGVAIATALMPPLCTAGFGLATGQWRFLFGALYLFLINSVIICLATVIVVRVLRFPRVQALDPARERRVRLVIAAAVALTVIPSAVAAWNVVHETVYLAAARRFVNENLVSADRSVIASNFTFGRDSSTIVVTLVGRPLLAEMRSNLEERLASSGLARTRLVIREPMGDGPQVADVGQVVRAGILDELYRKNQQVLDDRDNRIRVLEDEVVRLRAAALPIGQLSREVKALHPALLSLGFGRTVPVGDSVRADTVVVVLTTWRRLPRPTEIVRLREFLTKRLSLDSIDLILRRAR